MIRQRDTVHPQFFTPFQQLTDAVAPVKKTIVAVNVKMGKLLPAHSGLLVKGLAFAPRQDWPIFDQPHTLRRPY